MKALCERAGMSRQNFYKTRKERTRREVDEDLVEYLVREERKDLPRAGGRKLHAMLRPALEKAGVDLGRDCFFKVLSRKGLLVPPLPKGPRTTHSNHSLPVYRNRVKGLRIDRPNQVWVSDITYLRTEAGFAYLSLVTDAFSHKILGWNLGRLLNVDETEKALEMALGQKPGDAKVIHHSDRGSQYCSHRYTGILERAQVEISMTEENHCAENSVAERLNGILKQEHFLGDVFEDIQRAGRSVAQAVTLYNNRRLHTSLGMKTPEEVHQCTRPLPPPPGEEEGGGGTASGARGHLQEESQSEI